MKTIRFVRLIKCDLLVRQSTLIVSSITVAAFLFLFNLTVPSNMASVNANPSMYYFILFFGGFWLTGNIFNDIHDKKQTYFLLTLPCANTEKFFSRWLISSVGYALGTLILYTIIYWLIAFVNALIFRSSLILFNPMQLIIGQVILQYLIVQSIFFLGAIYFKKNPLLKTILTLMLISVVVAIFTALFSFATFSPLFFAQTLFVSDFSNMNFASIGEGSKFLFWVLLAPFCLWVAYQRLTECEDR